MRERHTSREKMEWLEMDVLNMSFEDESFDLVIDKGEPYPRARSFCADHQEQWSECLRYVL